MKGAGIRSGQVWFGRLGALESCFRAGFVVTAVWLVETGVWLPQVAADGRRLPRFDKKAAPPTGRGNKKGVTAPRVEACNSLLGQTSMYQRYRARRNLNDPDKRN